MKQLSYWAKNNPGSAKFLILLLYIPINITGFITGYLLWDIGLQLEAAFIQIIITLVIALFIFNPAKASFYKRKFLQGLMACCTFCIIVFFGNQYNNSNPYLSFAASTHAVTHVKNLEKPTTAKASKIKKENRQQKKETKKLLRRFSDKTGLPLWAKILLIVLVVAGAMGLLYVLAYLVCSISCSGAEALAVIVAIIGLAAVIAGCFFAIRAILGRKKKNRKGEVSGN